MKKTMIAMVLVLVTMLSMFAFAEENEVVDAKELTGNVEISMKNSAAEIELGDIIVLQAKVTGANADVEIRWEKNEGNGWKELNVTGNTYTYELNENNLDSEYRAYIVEA